jgi:hypothetical protein
MTSNAQIPSALLNGTPDDMLRSMLILMRDMKQIYLAEKQAISSKALKDFIALQPLKTQFMQQFEIGLKAIRTKGDAIKSASPALRAEIITLQAEMDELASLSMTWSERMVESIRRMQTRLIEAGRRSIQPETPLYNPKGAMGSYGTRVQSTAINQAY